jgi:hypothetical protein
VLYVNNIRSYYNIIRWLTGNEPQPEDMDPAEEAEDVVEPKDIIAAAE